MTIDHETSGPAAWVHVFIAPKDRAERPCDIDLSATRNLPPGHDPIAARLVGRKPRVCA
jgi:hypothetical protein